MRNVGIALAGVLVGTAAMMASAADAVAQPRMLVLVDASGSMSIERPGDAVTPTRFAAAKAAAIDEVIAQAGTNSGLRVAVYTFSDSSSSLQTVGGFVDPNDAIDSIEGLDLFTVGGGSTPLAGSMCAAVSTLVEAPTAIKLLHVSSDGEENSTPMGNICYGPTSSNSTPPYTPGSWQRRVRDHAFGRVTVSVSLFAFSPALAPKRAVVDPEAKLTAAAQRGPQVADDRPPTLAEFFGELAASTGGVLKVVADEAPLPVSGDLNGDRCVDRNDALSVARSFGAVSSPAKNVFDINHDGVIGFADYNFVASQIGQGCTSPPIDPYVASGPLTCPANGGTLTIDGKAVSSATFPISGGHNCRIVIRNSLIVGGVDAISMNGNNRVTVDNSIVVGQRGVIGVVGFTKLSAAKTIFHGPKTEPDGALEYVDRGGNVWEE